MICSYLAMFKIFSMREVSSKKRKNNIETN
jgi:hypothetical protein